MSFYIDIQPIPDELYAKYPAFVHLGVMSNSVVLHLPHCFSGDGHVVFHRHPTNPRRAVREVSSLCASRSIQPLCISGSCLIL